jgi:hypothetical protein
METPQTALAYTQKTSQWAGTNPTGITGSDQWDSVLDAQWLFLGSIAQRLPQLQARLSLLQHRTGL